jgi:hypothetical protein
MARLTSRLAKWTDIERDGWKVLLMGNGASLAISRRFRYGSLFQTASLTADDRAVFHALDTTNFEAVLDSLRIARLVCAQEGHQDADVRHRYRAIRRGLIEAVNTIHPVHADVPTVTLKHVARAMRAYQWVFTTNYDLLVYWALMSINAVGFRDYFWGDDWTFDATDTDVRAGLSRVLYLHGALHLIRDDLGRTAKRVAEPAGILWAVARSGIPLFVSEGTSRDKLRAIRRSDYLSFAHTAFPDRDEAIVVFGHSLGAQDTHLIAPLNVHGRSVAVAVVKTTDRAVLRRKAEVRDLLPHANLIFFDAVSHPLGDPALQITP